MNNSTLVRIVCFLVLVFGALVSTCLSLVLINSTISTLVFITTFPSSLMHMSDSLVILTWASAIFTIVLYVLVLLFGWIEIRNQLLSLQIKREHWQQPSPPPLGPGRYRTNVPSNTGPMGQQQAQYIRSTRW